MKVKHYHTSSDRDVIPEFLLESSLDIRQDYFDAIAFLEAGKTLEMPLSRNLFSIYIGLHELRLRDSSGQVRFFYYIKKKTGIFVLHAFKKKRRNFHKKK
jgi:phage-related protein